MKPYNLVIVEDDGIIATDIESRLTNSGFNVSGKFASGEKLLKEIQPPYPDAALMDIRIEGPLDGIETAKELSAQFNIPTIFLTAHSDTHTLNKAIESKPLGYITKPFSSEDISETVKSVLIRHNLEKSRIEYQIRLEQKLQRHVKDLELINKLNTASFEEKDIHNICMLVSERIRKVFSSFGSAVYFLNKAQDTLIMESSNITTRGRKKIEKILNSEIPNLKLSLDRQSIHKEVITKRKPQLITGSEKIESFLRTSASITLFEDKYVKKLLLKMLPGIFKFLKIKSFLLIPLIVEKRIFGIISISSRNILSESDLRRLENISNQLALILNRKILQNDLKKEKIAAENSDKLKSIFLANMSHEIRTPLNSIIGFTDLVLADSTLNETNKEFLQNSKDSSRLLLKLINDILDLSKIEAGQITISETECSLTDMMDSIGERANILIQSKKDFIEIRKSYQSNIAEYIKCDSFRLEQILNNLIGNAAKFTDFGYLEYGFTKKNKMLEFYVRDTGLGIPKEKQKDIFQPFIQADSDTTLKFGGTGLGLTITKKLVELMGGSINLVSTEGMGCTFYFTIPYKPVLKSKKTAVDQLNSIVNVKGKKIKILIVEDDKVSQRLAEAILEKHNFPVVLSNNGRDAVSRYKTDRSIGLILMDNHLPLLNGLEATKIIRGIEKTENRKKISIIALTASAMKGDKEKFISSGCNAYMTKPLNMNTLIETINKFSR